MEDIVNHPPHYTQHPSGVECIDVTEHMNFNCGNAVKYIWRADLKGSDIENLEKAKWYISREIERRKKYGTGKVNSGVLSRGPIQPNLEERQHSWSAHFNNVKQDWDSYQEAYYNRSGKDPEVSTYQKDRYYLG